MTPDVARYMPAVAELLLGQPNQALSSNGELRYGSYGSLAVDVSAGRWFDHERGEGGGVLDLIGREQHCGRAQAMQWLLDNVDGAAEEAAETDAGAGGGGPRQPRLLARARRIDGRIINIMTKASNGAAGEQELMLSLKIAAQHFCEFPAAVDQRLS